MSYPQFTESEYATRYSAVRSKMATSSLDALIIYGNRSSSADVHYLSNWLPTREAYLIVPFDGNPCLLVQLFNHVETARRMSYIKEVRFAGTNREGAVDSRHELVDTVKEKGPPRGRVGLVGPIPYQHYMYLKEQLNSLDFVDFGAELRRIRLVKSPQEVERIRLAARMTDLAMRELAATLEPGLSEFDVARIVDTVHLRHGGYTTVRHLLSTSMLQPEQAVPHQYPTERVLGPGDVLVLELSGALWGYSGQVIRTFSISKEPTDLYKRLHKMSVETFERIVSTISVGVGPEQIYEASDLIEQSGLTIIDDLVHGAGQLPPILRTRRTSHGYSEEFKFKDGMCVVVQPNVATLDGLAGVQYGAMLHVTERGTEVLHELDSKLQICG